MKRTLFAVLLFAATTAVARPVITAIEPSSAPAGGGTVVTFEGSGFAMLCAECDPPEPPWVWFGHIQAPHVELVDEHTLRVTVPPHLPRTVTVLLTQTGGNAVLADSFTFTGPAEEGFERILLPVFTRGTGAGGSRFRTELFLANTTDEIVYLYGMTPACFQTCPEWDPLESPYEVYPGNSNPPYYVYYTGTPGLFVYMPENGPRPLAHLRVRSEPHLGTELPVVYEREFTTEPIRLLGVPSDPRFRTTLRIYAAEETEVTIVADGISTRVTLPAGANVLQPAYAQLAGVSGDVKVIPSTASIWAFVSVTNNETHAITTISPQR